MALTDRLASFTQWFAGGDTPYHNLVHCMSHDTPWIAITVALDIIVAVGYVLIAYHWRQNERLLSPSPARKALATMRGIFTFCGICGYVFVPIKMVWPAWRLYDGFMLVLVFYTWTYALNAKRLKVVYTAIGRSEGLAEDLSKAREESARKTFFLNAISHDLRTPLNGLMLSANLAELHVQDGDTASAEAQLEQIKASARHTSDLLDGLLEFARMGSDADRVQRSLLDIDEVVHEAVAAHVNAAAAKSVELNVTGDLGLTLETDRLKVWRVLNNLLANAVRFTPHGSITVDIRRHVLDVTIGVIDTGIGIETRHLDRLFDEFFQVYNDERDREKGLGLGLAISRRLVHQLGGELRVESTVGSGSRFSVVLPTPDPVRRVAVEPDVAPVEAGAVAR